MGSCCWTPPGVEIKPIIPRFPCPPSSTLPSTATTILRSFSNALFFTFSHGDIWLRSSCQITSLLSSPCASFFLSSLAGSTYGSRSLFSPLARSPVVDRVFLMPIATSLSAAPRPAALVKMDERKRPAVSAVDDLAPPSKRLNINGGGKSRDDSADKGEDAWIEVCRVTRQSPSASSRRRNSTYRACLSL